MTAPSNFLATNPEVLRLTLETRGENLLRGLKNMLEDLERGKGRLAVRMTDLDAFEVGKNIATTPGKVVFQNDLMQLIQYAPSTEEVHRRPLMIVPPWINKFYILDLQPKNSFIKYCVDQGFTVFVLSWVNPDETLSHKSFEHYMFEGPLAALDAIEQATGEREVNAIGYCLGGTLLASTLAWMKEKDDDRIKSATFFTTLVDFTDPGELGVFMDEEQLAALEKTMAKRGYLDGAEMAASFNLLRASDLIWSFVINNYLLGKDPFPFDLLVLELRQHPHAGGDAQLLPAQVLLRERAGTARRRQPGRRPDRPHADRPAGLLGLHQGGPYRPLEEHLRRDPALPGPEEVRAGRLGPYCRRGQPAGLGQVRLLAQRRAAGRPGSLVRRCPAS